MIELKDVTVKEKSVLEKYLKLRENGAAEISFANLCMWRRAFGLKYAIVDDVLCFYAIYTIDGKRCFSLPAGFYGRDGSTGDIRQIVSQLEDYLKSNNKPFVLRFCDEEDVKILQAALPEKFEVYEDRDSFDYVYRVEDLINLSGKKYHSKKNHINKFKKVYPHFEYCRLTSADTEECLALFNRWRGNKEDNKQENVETMGLDDEYIAIKELMSNLEEFGATAAGIRIDGKLIAFSCGEALDDKTVLIHLEHADTDYEGAFAVINQQFLEHEWGGYEFVNREEDMGIPGMRRAKESYRPVTMIKKFIVKPKI